MDVRTEKTKRAIYNEFLALKAKYPIEEITIKELCMDAKINKSTFYTHYKSIYDLAEEIEDSVISDILRNIREPEKIFTELKAFTSEMFLAFLRQERLITLLFDSRNVGTLVEKIDKRLSESIFERRPEYKDKPECQIVIDYCIYGSYFAFQKNRTENPYTEAKTLKVITELSDALLTSLKKNNLFN